MEEKGNNTKTVRRKEYTSQEFFHLLTQLYLGQMKRETFYTDNNHINIYNEAVKLIQNKARENPENAENYAKLLEIADRFYDLVTDTTIREEIIEKDIKIPEFMHLYKERILGDKKRKYDMSDMFRQDYISATVDRITGQKNRNVVYIPQRSPQHTYQNKAGQTVIIEEIGSLHMEEWNGVASSISKYRIQRQIGEEQYAVDEIYSNIRIIDMDNPQYREAVFNELLGENNVTLSNTSGYVGEIVEVPVELSKERIGTEKTVGGDTYFYKINDKYALKYEGKDISAVMIYEKGREMSNNSNIIPTRRKLQTAEKEGTTNQGLNVDDASR